MAQEARAFIDPNVPNVARMYDYFLGGTDNYAVDRAAAERVRQASPYVPVGMRENRHFLRRAVTTLAHPEGECHIEQFLDIGAGLPTQGNVHEIVRAINPRARVLYVDNDPVVIAHARARLADSDNVRVMEGDARRIDDIICQVASDIDWEQPVGVLLLGILHFITDDHRPYEIVSRLRERLAPGSCLAISHGTADGFAKILGSRRRVQSVRQEYDQATESLALRRRSEVARFFDGLDMLEPGLVALPSWRPDGIDEGLADPHLCGMYGGIGRVPTVAV